MGMGKTIETIALILAKITEQDQRDQRTGGTLIGMNDLR
jgi:hypothetical protein